MKTAGECILNMKTIKEIYLEAKKRLNSAGIEDSAFNAACILKKHTGIERHEIALIGDREIQCDLTGFWADIKRREGREPLQYIIGMWPFYGLDFYVGDGVLIPRPDTEILCDAAIRFLKGKKNPKVLELCAGSGCVSTAIAKNVENCTLCCLELSDNALFYLNKNLIFHGLSESAKVIKANVLLGKTAKSLPDDFDVLVCNPPYIKSGDIKGLEPEVSSFEPRLALDGGEDGLEFYRAAKNYIPLLKTGGMAAFEVGIGQSSEVSALLDDFGLGNIFVNKDFANINRVVGGYKKKL